MAQTVVKTTICTCAPAFSENGKHYSCVSKNTKKYIQLHIHIYGMPTQRLGRVGIHNPEVKNTVLLGNGWSSYLPWIVFGKSF
jgi:hypothetical protein